MLLYTLIIESRYLFLNHLLIFQSFYKLFHYTIIYLFRGIINSHDEYIFMKQIFLFVIRILFQHRKNDLMTVSSFNSISNSFLLERSIDNYCSCFIFYILQFNHIYYSSCSFSYYKYIFI